MLHQYLGPLADLSSDCVVARQGLKVVILESSLQILCFGFETFRFEY